MSNKQTQPVVMLSGRRIYLRPVEEGDLIYYRRWLNDQETAQYLTIYLPLTETAEKEWFEQMHKNKNNIVLTIVERRTDRPIGNMGIHQIDWKDRRASTGAIIGEKRFRDRGIGFEAKMLLLHYAFNTLNLRKICSGAHAFNKRSIAYSQKCGYKVEGILRQHIFRNGDYQDDVLLAVFKEDWLPIWNKHRHLIVG